MELLLTLATLKFPYEVNELQIDGLLERVDDFAYLLTMDLNLARTYQ